MSLAARRLRTPRTAAAMQSSECKHDWTRSDPVHDNRGRTAHVMMCQNCFSLARVVRYSNRNSYTHVMQSEGGDDDDNFWRGLAQAHFARIGKLPVESLRRAA